MNGIYKATYSVPGDTNNGIVFIDNGKFYGTDKTHAFYGDYTISDKKFSANLTRVQHSAPGYNMGGGGKNLAIEGVVNGNTILGRGTIPGVPVKIDISLQRIQTF